MIRALVLLMLACMLLAPRAAAAQPTRLWLDTSDGIHVFSDQLPGGLSRPLLNFSAMHYAGTQKMTRADADTLRGVNPNFFVLHYRLGGWLGDRSPDAHCQPAGNPIQIIDGTWTPEWPGDSAVRDAWFFHLNGSRVLNCAWGWWVMDLENADWRTYWSNQVVRQLADNDDDGVFADSLSVPNYFGGAAFRPALADFDPAFESDWSGRIQRFIAYATVRLDTPCRQKSFQELPKPSTDSTKRAAAKLERDG